VVTVLKHNLVVDYMTESVNVLIVVISQLTQTWKRILRTSRGWETARVKTPLAAPASPWES